MSKSQNNGTYKATFYLYTEELVLTTRVATKGHKLSNAFVTSFFVTLSVDGLSYFNFEVDGERQV